jgi:prepilin-type N-terminal cleavage/methylation domain-containing protein
MMIPCRDNTPGDMNPPSRAMTLIELLVATAVMLVVLGIATEIFIESGRTARLLSNDEAASLYASEVMFKLRETIQSAVHPSNVSGTPEPPSTLVECNTDRLSLLTYRLRGTGSALYHVTFTNSVTEDGISIINERVRNVFDNKGPARNHTVAPLLPDDVTPLIRFSYASAGKPGQTPDYPSSWPAGQWPDLVQVTLTLVDRKKTGQPMIFQSAFMPGLVGHQRPSTSAKPLEATAGQAGTPHAAPDTPSAVEAAGETAPQNPGSAGGGG